MAFGREVVNAWYPEIDKVIVDEDDETFYIEATYKGHVFNYIQAKDGSPPLPFNPVHFMDKLFEDNLNVMMDEDP